MEPTPNLTKSEIDALADCIAILLDDIHKRKNGTSKLAAEDEPEITIYRLIDPRDKSIRYVGQTKNSLQVRLNHHCSRKGEKQSSARKVWIMELRNENLKPLIESIECVRGHSLANRRERYWIQKYKSEGLDLLNDKPADNENLQPHPGENNL